MRGATVEEQVQWVLSYMQGESADVWKENVMEEMESGEVEYESAEEILASLKKEFRGGEEESIKAAELRKLEQGGRMMEEFVQEFKRAARGKAVSGGVQARDEWRNQKEIDGGRKSANLHRKLVQEGNSP